MRKVRRVALDEREYHVRLVFDFDHAQALRRVVRETHKTLQEVMIEALDLYRVVRVMPLKNEEIEECQKRVRYTKGVKGMNDLRRNPQPVKSILQEVTSKMSVPFVPTNR